MEKQVDLPYTKDQKRLLYRLFSKYRREAKERGFEFSLSKEFFYRTVLLNCFYCGRPPSQEIRDVLGCILRGGIDRVDNNIGYIENNCVPCCKWCNYEKGTSTLESFLNGRHG